MSSMINFYYDCKDKYGLGIDMYRLDTKKLSDENLYLIFPRGHEETFYVIDYLRHITFSNGPSKLKTESKVMNGIEIFAASVPKEYRETCEKIAKNYNLSCHYMSVAALDSNSGVVIPKSDKILVIRGQYSHSEHQKEVERLKYIGRVLDKLGVD